VIMVAGHAPQRADASPDAGVGWLVSGQPVNGLAMGTALAAPRAVTVLARVTPRRGRPAAGVLSTVQRVGNALGVELLEIVSYGR
jgi:hypothetical protein